MEKMTGPDAVLLNMETPELPMHTLKIVVLDTAHRAPLTLDDVRAAVEPYLGVVRRATQRVHTGPGCGGRPFWVDEENFDLGAHLDEITLTIANRAHFDALCARLAEQHLDRSRPLWAMTLVHGLEGGRQAVIVRVHHAIADGVAALNTFLAVTTDQPGAVAPSCPAGPAAPHPLALEQAVRREVRGLLTGLPGLAGAARASRRAASDFEGVEHVPSGLGAPRTSFNAPGGGDRVCASGALDLADLKRIARASGATINGVLHAVIAGAMRAEYEARGERCDVANAAAFGVAADTSSPRRWGNEIAPAAAYLHVEIADPLERLRATARSCLLAVDLRRRRGFELTARTFDYLPRLTPALRARFAPRVRRVVNNITTANVAGPRTTRWFGNIEVVEWISYAVAVAPADVNLTCYSYAGRMRMGLVATPETMPDPAGFLTRLQRAVDELLAAVETEEHAHAVPA